MSNNFKATKTDGNDLYYFKHGYINKLQIDSEVTWNKGI